MHIENLINIKDLSKQQIMLLLTQANNIAKQPHKNNLNNTSVAILMFEPSTRTLNSFALAAMNLQAKVLTPNLAQSSKQKGESDLDTVRTFAAMGVDIIALRHHQSGFAADAAAALQDLPTKIINAGDGNNSHPTQALLDLLSIYNHFGDAWSSLQISIVGDCRRSRAVNSLIAALNIMGTEKINLVCPEELKPIAEKPGCKIYSSLSEGIKNSDVVYTLRLQTEREQISGLSGESYIQNFRLDENNIKNAKKDAVIMHPGPVNENIEITTALAQSKNSLIHKQIKNGVLIRCAILQAMANNG